MMGYIGSLNKPSYYILVGDEASWEIAITKGIWGFSDRTRGLWNTTNQGDLLAFYVTSPVKRVIGFGKLTDKSIEEEIVYPDELLYNKPIWKYRVRFEILYSLHKLEDGIPLSRKIVVKTGRKLVSKKVFVRLVKKADSKSGTNILCTANLSMDKKDEQSVKGTIPI